MHERINFIAALRADTKHNRDECARVLSMTPKHLGKILRGENKFTEPHVVFMRKILDQTGFDSSLYDFDYLPPDPEDMAPSEVLRAKGWSVTRLAEYIGYPRAIVDDFLNGENLPDDLFEILERIRLIAVAVHCKATNFNWINDMQQRIAYDYDCNMLKPPPTQADIEAYKAYLKELGIKFPWMLKKNRPPDASKT